ncbi:MAG: hypothetical protein A3B89_01685 [Candidatus Buchananbacteria bacterium RIFCSPHIGHO2_02_FULL_40_13]|uniref:DUF4870 domain-containing protein n=1 Tax=Candidatus Buchananbacteria bacterium RIFCSPLOWO2_01_FULL_39_33 TaxID=1797543 RepID=A0A1G1YLB6_9BACT|nr:MAG: hypothetical protein A3B89_01685 [Candidatus Buchananbacteria bacterium RIFCSPHIGHO2_02_FULL_40_13]OGY52257.1 MAG: hypothetical protein A3A02_01635 [Candidatus Buchananbacteria bacterium RIFCSPLOWO2_01_FULL_39_33]
MAQSKKITQEEKIWAAISYLWILSLVALVARKNNDYVRFHANQGFLLFILSLFWWFPVLGWLLSLVILVLVIVGIIKSFQGEEWSLPLIAPAAKKAGHWFVKTIKL